MRELLKDVIKERQGKENYDLLFETIDRIIEHSNIGRQEGLLSLEENVEAIETPKLLKTAIMLIVDGTDPDIVKESCITRAYINMGEADPLVDYACIIGALAIQSGESPRIVTEKMMALLPYDKQEEYMSTRKKEEPKGIPQSFFSENTPNSYNSISKLHAVLFVADKTEVVRIVGESDKADIAVALKGLGGKARQTLFEVMPDDMQQEIYEDYEYMGPINNKILDDSVGNILKVIKRLSDSKLISETYTKVIGE